MCSGRMCKLHRVGTHIPGGTMNQHSVTRANFGVAKEHLSGGHRYYRHRGRLEEVATAGFVCQHLSGGHGVLCVRAGKAGIGNPEHLSPTGKGLSREPVASTVPARSAPSVSGRGCGNALRPARIHASHGPTPAA